MEWLFAQMWALEMAAFLLGAAVTWLVFVRPARAAARAARPVPLPPDWASTPSLRTPEADPSPSYPPSTSSTDSALADLDAHARHARRRIGLFAAGHLDLVEVTSPLPIVEVQSGSPSTPEPR